MNDQSLSKLQANLDAANKRIANHKPLERNAAIEKVRAFATECRMTVDDLFPNVKDEYEYPSPEPEPFWEKTPFADFCHPDTFNYTFLTDLEERRNNIETDIFCLLRERQMESIERVRAFIQEYKLTKAEIYPTSATSPDQK